MTSLRTVTARLPGLAVGPAVALALALATAFATGPAPAVGQESEDTLSGTVRGTVYGVFQGDLAPLGFATIQALAPGYRRSVVADSLGHYVLSSIPPGPVRIQVTHPGHDPLTLEVIVPSRGPVHVDLELQGRPVELPPVEVSPDPRIPDPEGREIDAGSMARVEAIALEAGVGVGMPGLVDAVRGIPGNDPANPTDVLFMRGSTTDMKLVLLDGAPVFTPFHVAGLLTSFEPSVLDRATLHVGGAPARYDGGLTYILDLGTRRPRRDRGHLSGALDLLSGSVGLEGPLGDRAGVLFSGRTLHNVGDGPLGGISPYGYADALAGAEFEPVAGHLLNATGFWNRESVRLDFGNPIPEAERGAWWANRAAGITYHGDYGGLTADVTLAASSYDATLPLLPSATDEDPEPAPLLATAANDRTRLVAELARPSAMGTSRVGLSYESQEARYDARLLLGGGGTSRTAASARAMGAFVDVSRTLSPHVSIRVGARLDDLTGARGGVRFAPRGSVTFTVAPMAFVTVAAGRYHQHARATDVDVERTLADVTTTAVSGDELLPVATADHVVLSLDQGFGETTRMGVQGFWKRYQGLPGGNAGPVLSSGLDLRVRSLGPRVTAWLGYGLSWFWSEQGLGSTSAFSGRHLLSAGVSGRLLGPLQGAARVAYGAGLPYTAIPFGIGVDEGLAASDPPARPAETAPPLAGGLDDEFLRLDLEVHAVLTPEWGGRTWELKPYLRILNALDRRDALFYTFQPWRDEAVRPLAQRPLLPVVGIAWKF